MPYSNNFILQIAQTRPLFELEKCSFFTNGLEFPENWLVMLSLCLDGKNVYSAVVPAQLVEL